MSELNSVCLAMLVRDESAVIARCLQSLKTVYSSYFIIDTGSLDGTAEIIEEELGHLEGAIVRRPFSSFAMLREELYLHASKLGNYVFFIDADETLLELSGSPFEVSLPDIGMVEIDFHSHCRRLPRLFRNELDISWKGHVYETPVYSPEAHVEVLAKLRLRKHGDGYRSRQDRQAQSDTIHLLADLDGSQRDAEILLNLAEIARRNGQLDHARLYCQQCIKLEPDPRVLWQAYYQYGLLSKEAGAETEYVMQAFMHAYELFPDRAEPLSGMINCLNESGQKVAAESMSAVAAEIPVPANATYFEPVCYVSGPDSARKQPSPD